MIRRWIFGKDLMERWQINALDLVDIVLYERLHVYEPDGRLAKYEHEDSIRANHPSPFSPSPKKENPSIYEMILNSEAYDFELPAIPIPPDYIPLAKRIENYMFDLIEVKRIEKELNIILHDLDKHVQTEKNLNKTYVSTASTDEINTRAVKESGNISDQLLENSGVGLFEEKFEDKSALTTSMAEENIFRKEDDFWKIIYQGERLRPIKDAKGLRYIAILLQNPEHSFHVMDLVRLVNGSDNPIKESYSRMSRERLSKEELNPTHFGDAGQVIDGKALSEYKKEIKELEEDIDEAENNNDYARGEMLRKEKEFLEQQILAATDLKGRIRKLDDGSDRARKAVSVSIKASIEKIRKKHPELGQHLENSIKRGYHCSYLPDKPISWTI